MCLDTEQRLLPARSKVLCTLEQGIRMGIVSPPPPPFFCFKKGAKEERGQGGLLSRIFSFYLISHLCTLSEERGRARLKHARQIRR